jgi:choline-glycine betaine transporter
MKNIKPLVFLPPFLLCAAFVLLQFIDQQRPPADQQFVGILKSAFQWVAGSFGWLVSLLAFGMMALCVAVYVSPFGRTVLGGAKAKKLLTNWQMFAVVLTTNIAAGILFWGVFEPTWHLSHPPGGIIPQSPEAARFAISTSYLHWTLTPYAFGSLVGLMFAFAYYNMKRPFSLGAPLSPLLGKLGDGRLAQVIDAICLYCLIAALTAALGGSSMLMGGGINHLLGVTSPPSNWLIGIIIA